MKKGKRVPEGFRLAEVDAFTGHMFGVEPVAQSGFKAMMEEALRNAEEHLESGTFELCGPEVNGNPEGFDKHLLIRHGSEVFTVIPDMRTLAPSDAFELLKVLFKDLQADGGLKVLCGGD